MFAPIENPVAEFVQSKTKVQRMFFIWAIFTAVVVVLTIALPLSLDIQTLLFFAAMLILVPGSLAVWTGIKAFRPPRRLELYTNGFILRNVKDESVIDSRSWSEVNDITWAADNRKAGYGAVGGALGGILGAIVASALTAGVSEQNSKRNVYIHCPGKRLAIDESFWEQTGSEGVLQAVTSQFWTEEVINALDSGQSIRLGNLELTSVGMIQGKQVIEWKSVLDASYTNDEGTTVTITYHDTSKNKERKIYTTLGYKGSVLCQIVRKKIGKPESMTSKLGKL